MPDNIRTMTIHEKLQRIGEMCDVLVKDASGYNYKYVKEEAVLAKVKAGFKKYRVNMYTQIVPGTFTVTPYTYDKYDAKAKATKPINEFIVQAQTLNTFVNIDNPEEKLEVPFAMVASMEDPSMASGSALSFSNRYFLLKFFQIPTTTDDPEIYRTKQKEAEDFEELQQQKEAAEELQKQVKAVVTAGTELIKAGFKKDDVMEIVARHNGGNRNPASIKDVAVCTAVLNDFATLQNNKKEN